MEGEYVDTRVQINGKKRRALVWIGCCGKAPSEASMLDEAKKRGVDRVVVTCRPSWEKVTAVALKREGNALKEEARRDISLGGSSTLFDCSYECPDGVREDFNVFARKGESADQACRRKLAERLAPRQVTSCRKLRAREIQ